MNKRRSLNRKLTIIIGLALVAVVLLVSFVSNFFINREFASYLSSQQDYQIEDIILSVSNQYYPEYDAWDQSYLHAISMSALDSGYIVKVYDNLGRTVWDTEEYDGGGCRQMRENYLTRRSWRLPANSGELIYSEYPLAQNGAPVGYMEIGHYGPYVVSENEYTFIRALNAILLAIGGLALLLAVALGKYIAGKISSPIKKAVAAANNLAKGNYPEKIEIKTDTQELYELMEAVNKLAASLEEQELLRKQLTADIAHELRTPLTSISTHIEAMIVGMWEPTPERLEGIYSEIERLTELVAELGNLARADRGETALHKSPTSLKALAERSLELFAVEIERKQISASITGEDVKVFADGDKLYQAVQNLVGNSVKYSLENGEISINIWQDSSGAHLSVKDKGIGIPEEEIPFIFERFYRAEKSRNRETGGSGIGLAVVKSIIEAHGGSVKAQSKADQGSLFTINLPIDKK